LNVYDVFVERGFVSAVTDEKGVRDLLDKERVTCYIGFDPTAPSLHVGSLVPIMALVHMQRAGHRPIALVGGGTALIGDPSGKSEMRQVLTHEQVSLNAAALKGQLSKFIHFGTSDGALLLNNADWLTQLNYIEFLRDIGRHFSVNRMLAAESYRMRLEAGLNFIEFNYMLLQSYDFYHLFKNYECAVQMGGNDQWGNIVAGIDLIRRLTGKDAFGITFPLITTSLGQKMGKTEKGTIWLDPNLTTPYDYYQYWVNCDDRDVERFLSLFTFLPMDEIREAGRLRDAELNMAKAVLAYEATKIAHGEEAARSARQAAVSVFKAKPVSPGILPSSTIPRGESTTDDSAISRVVKSRAELEKGIPAYKLFTEANLCASQGESRRLISQGGGYINDRKITSFDELIGLKDFSGQPKIYLRKGKKKYSVVEIEG